MTAQETLERLIAELSDLAAHPDDDGARMSVADLLESLTRHIDRGGTAPDVYAAMSLALAFWEAQQDRNETRKAL